MTVADKLSKTDTKWVLKQTFQKSLEQKLGLEVTFADIANTKIGSDICPRHRLERGNDTTYGQDSHGEWWTIRPCMS